MEATMETIDERMRMFSDAQIREFEKASEAIRERMSPAGAMGLPPLLDERRLEWGITDNAFAVQAAFDRVLVFQIPDKHFAQGRYGEDSRIVIPENQKDGRKRAAPRGIIVSAGLKAMDELKSNGFELGDIVMFNIVQPYRVETDVINGKVPYLLVMHTGHLIGSEDTARRLRSGDLSIAAEPMPDGSVVHVYRDRAGKTLTPTTPELGGEY